MCRSNRSATLQQVPLPIENPKSEDGFRARAPLPFSSLRNPPTMAPLNGDLSADRGALMLLDRRPLTKSTVPRRQLLLSRPLPSSLILIYRRFHVNSSPRNLPITQDPFFGGPLRARPRNPCGRERERRRIAAEAEPRLFEL